MKDRSISLNAAIDILDKWLAVEGYSEGEINVMRAMKTELEALPSAQPEPCEDTISRQAAIDALGERPMVWTNDDEYALGERNQYDIDRLAIETVPSVQPEPSEIARDIATIIENERDMRVILKNSELCDDAVLRASVEYICRKNTVSTNPYEHKYHDKFIQFLDDPEISDFGRWQHSNGFNTALVAVKCDLDKVPSVMPKAEQTEYIPDTKAIPSEKDCVDLSERVTATFYDDEYEEWSQKTVTIRDVLDSVCDEYTVLPSVTPKQRWIPCSERLPSKEECKKWIDKNVDGIGYLYPCLVTRYSSINPDRTKNNPYVAKHYFDGEDFLNASEEVCNEYIIAWMPLPEPYMEEGGEA